MNLADAIRKAAQHVGPHPTTQAAVFTPAHAFEPEVAPEVEAPVLQETVEAPTTEPVLVPIQFEASLPKAEENAMPENENAHPSPGTLVRMELFLTPEQLSSLFKAVMANQHTMLTSREAASLLRIPAHSVEEMAVAGTLPGMQIDGRWRFARQAIEEWLHAGQAKKEAA